MRTQFRAPPWGVPCWGVSGSRWASPSLALHSGPVEMVGCLPCARTLSVSHDLLLPLPGPSQDTLPNCLLPQAPPDHSGYSGTSMPSLCPSTSPLERVCLFPGCGQSLSRRALLSRSLLWSVSETCQERSLVPPNNGKMTWILCNHFQVLFC